MVARGVGGGGGGREEVKRGGVATCLVGWGRKVDGFKIKVKKGEQVKRECEQCLRKERRKVSPIHSVRA